jgi:hypothetical protein
MHFSEDDLRAALRREDPGEDFTQRVLRQLDQPSNAPKISRRRFAFLRVRPAVLAFAAVVLMTVGIWLGFRENQRVQQARARRAEQDAILALRITNAKLNRVLERVNQPQANPPKLRREVL